jgi:hypothetical protein
MVGLLYFLLALTVAWLPHHRVWRAVGAQSPSLASMFNTTLLLRIVCWLVCVSVYQAHVQQVLRTLPAQFIAPQLLRRMPASSHCLFIDSAAL